MFLDQKKVHDNKIIISLIVFVLTLLVTLVVYLTGGVKYVYPHLMYIPIVICGFIFGFKWGIINAIIGGLLLGPLMPLEIATNEPQLFYNWFSRLVIFTIVGGLSGFANVVFLKQKKQINQSLYMHRFSAIPSPNYLRIIDYSNFDDKALFSTILIHNFQKIIDTFSQEFYFKLLNTIFIRLKERFNFEKVITSNNSDKIWMIIDSHNISEVNDILFTLLKKDFIIDGIPIYFDFSMGYNLLKIKGQEITTNMFNKTDLSAKQARLEEKRFLVANDNTKEEYNYHILSEFKNALVNNETFLEFQPKISIKSNEINLEALIRWQHPKKGLLPPNMFVPLIEETKLVNDLSLWVLTNVIKKIKYFEENNLYPVISLNISSKNLFNEEFIKEAIMLIDKSSVDPGRIEFEITESTIMNNIDESQKVLNKLNKYGIKLAIDDFGKGFSSLNYLAKLDVDYIKIDKSFIDRILLDEVYQKIVEYTIHLSHEIGSKVICEGVESIEQLELLKALGCDYVQGYYITRPIRANEVITWYENNSDFINMEKLSNKVDH